MMVMMMATMMMMFFFVCFFVFVFGHQGLCYGKKCAKGNHRAGLHNETLTRREKKKIIIGLHRSNELRYTSTSIDGTKTHHE